MARAISRRATNRMAWNPPHTHNQTGRVFGTTFIGMPNTSIADPVTRIANRYRSNPTVLNARMVTMIAPNPRTTSSKPVSGPWIMESAPAARMPNTPAQRTRSRWAITAHQIANWIGGQRNERNQLLTCCSASALPVRSARKDTANPRDKSTALGGTNHRQSHTTPHAAKGIKPIHMAASLSRIRRGRMAGRANCHSATHRPACRPCRTRP